MASWKDYKEDFILLVEAGFIAVNQSDEDSALKLFHAAAILNPNSILPKVGLGYLYLHQLALKQAVQHFEEALKQEPNNQMAKAFLGIALSFSPNLLERGEKILEQTAKTNDPSIKQLSEMAIDFAEKFIKKTPPPTHGAR